MSEEKLKQLLSAVAAKKRMFQQQLQSKKESDSRYQQQQRMTHEQKARAAMDQMTKNFKEYNDRLGKDISESEMRKEAQRIAEKVERKRDQ